VTFAPDVVSENQLPFYYPKVLYCTECGCDTTA
jgi:hypothetical protein